MRFTYIIFAMFIFTGILLGLGGFYNDLSETYSTNSTNATQPAILMYGELNSTTANMYTQMNSTQGGLSGSDTSIWTVFGLVLKAPVYIAKAFMSTGGNIVSAINTFTIIVGVPGWVAGLLITAVFFVIIVAVIRMTINKEF